MGGEHSPMFAVAQSVLSFRWDEHLLNPRCLLRQQAAWFWQVLEEEFDDEHLGSYVRHPSLRG